MEIPPAPVPPVSKSSINKLGKKIRRILKAGEKVDGELLQKLQEYRTSFRDDVKGVFNTISDLSKKERRDSIVSFRIKRIESIFSKIEREPNMSLGNMGDIAGCRVILNSETSLNNLKQKLEQTFKVKNVRDYTSDPKNDGYRGYHIYIESPINPWRMIEIQLRTTVSHKWASLVEIIDVLFGTKIKEGQQEPELQEFLKLLSLPKAELTIQNKIRVIELDKKWDIYSMLNEVFISNNISIRKSWIQVNKNQEKKYFIIEVDADKKSHITCFTDYKEAEDTYFQMFKSKSNSNFVLTFIESPKFKKFCIAYASYMLVRHDYVSDWSEFAREIIQSDLKNLRLYNDYFRRNINDRQSLISSEIEEIKNHLSPNQKVISRAVREWIDELVQADLTLREFKTDLNALSRKRRRRKNRLWMQIFGE